MLDHAGSSNKERAESVSPASVKSQIETPASFDGISKGFLQEQRAQGTYDGKSPQGPQKKFGAFSDALFETLISGERYTYKRARNIWLHAVLNILLLRPLPPKESIQIMRLRASQNQMIKKPVLLNRLGPSPKYSLGALLRRLLARLGSHSEASTRFNLSLIPYSRYCDMKH